jgi:hypothetical protein
MLFDGAFHVPGWLRQLAIQPIDVIAHCRREEGGEFGPPTQGTIALAEWLLADTVRAEREARKPGSPLSMGGVINRLLAGSIVPSEQLAESIGIMTGGKVTFDMFEREAENIPTETALAAIPVPDDAEGFVDCGRRAGHRSVLGETPSGPLFTADRCADIIQVHGLGVQLRMGLSAATRLRDTLSAALKQPPKAGGASVARA